MTLGFAGTHYDTFLSRLQGQKISYDAFDNTVLFDFFAKNPDAKLDDILPLVERYFGLKRYTKAELDSLNAAAKSGDGAAFAKLGLALQDYEIDDLQAAFNAQPKESDPAKRQQQMAALQQNPAYDIAYGYYSPFTVALTHTLNHKAGISWTSFSHTGLPTPVSVIGIGADLFNGYYDNTDIFKKVVLVGGL
jgi:alkaline phosphatase